MTEQPSARPGDEPRDKDEAPERPEDEELVGAEPEGAMGDTTAIKEAGEIGRPASTMRA